MTPTYVGILTSPPGRPGGVLNVSGPRPFGERTEHFAGLAQLAWRRGALVYVFAPAEVDWEKRRVTAALLRNGRWTKRRAPLPDVVYNRLPSRGVEAHPLVRRTKARLQALGIEIFNPGFFDKWQNQRILARHASLRPHLPDTEAFKDTAQVSRFLARFGRVYCKPRQGHAGSGIMLLEAGGGRNTLRLLQAGSVHTTAFARTPALARAAARRMAGRGYLVQQAMPVAQYRGRAFDFRLLLHKGPSNRWRISGVGVRVAGQGGITTHLPNGGSLAKPGEVLERVFKQGLRHPDGVYRRARRLALAAARSLDDNKGGRLAEMSVDIGVGPQGQLWFFEANAKPMRFDEARIQNRGRLRLVRYLLSRARART